MKLTSLLKLSSAALAALVLVACGGGSHSATISGSVTGLVTGQTFILQNNFKDSLTISANGAFEFSTKIGSSDAYYVTILTQPAGEICQVANGQGAVNSSGDPVNNIAVTCTVTSSVGGTVSGLATGGKLILSNGTVLLPITANGAFAFPGVITAGTAYTITVDTQPTGQTCSLTNDTGVISSISLSAVIVTCV